MTDPRPEDVSELTTDMPAIDVSQEAMETHIPDSATLSLAGQLDADATKAFVREGGNASVHTRGLPTAIKGYEFIRELGRGGMGVVYLARQVQLKRLVALKVIRGVEGATAEDFERFAMEAEAVAALQHPHIVQIFEIGEHEGGPFCALEYVDGGSLSSEMKQREFSPMESAEILETLARAVHYAHQKSIIHRDLKPANVLLSADGTPKVSDFGLAKRLNIEDSGLTRTGIAIGTPAYMAPEQARGDTQRMGPAVDIYALGVILYELLARRLPFIGTSVIDTMQQVLNVDPQPPSSFGRPIPRDLETVCLKCLAKDPAVRYSSALALAQDLERYRSGEPILARRETLMQKAWRKVRKQAAILVTAAVAIFAIVAAVYAFRASSFAQRVAQTERQLVQGLDQPDWTTDQLDQLNGLASQLISYDAVRGELAHEKLFQRVADQVQNVLQRPRVTAELLPSLQSKIDWLASYRPELAKELQREVKQRVSDWQPTVELGPDFSELNAVFATTEARVSGQTVVRSRADFDRVPTLISSRGRVRVQARFDGDWQSAGALGLSMHHDPAIDAANTNATKHYEFVFVASKPDTNTGFDEATTEASTGPVNFRSTGGSGELRLIRNQVVLQRKRLSVTSPDVSILAERDGERLVVQINDVPAITFNDVMPLVGNDSSVFAVIWPAAAELKQLRVDSSLIPPAASPLEQADELYERGQFNEAITLYQQQNRLGGAAATESMCKLGLCALALNRPADAATAFEEVIQSEDERWPAVAATQYWLMQLRAKKYQEADALSSMVSVRFTPEQLAQYVPSAVREELMKTTAFPRVNMLIQDETLVPRLEALLRLANLLSMDDPVHTLRSNLMILHAINGNYQTAADVAKSEIELILAQQPLIRESSESLFYSARWYYWPQRMLKQSQQAKSELKYLIDTQLKSAESEAAELRFVQSIFLPLQLELARNAIDLQHWDEAESAVNRYLTEVQRPIRNYNFYSQPYLLLGFLQQHRGDQQGAIATWKQGLYSSYREQLVPADRPDAIAPSAMWGMIDFWIMASLSDTLTDQEAEQLWKRLIASATSDPIMGQFATALTVTPATVRNAWRTERGRELAQQMAFMSLPPVEFVRTPPLLVAYEKVRQELFSDAPSADEDEVIWRAVSGLANLYLSGKLNKSQGLQLALAWKGTSGIFGWAGVAPALPKEIKAEVTYLMCHRYLKLGQVDQAHKWFEELMADPQTVATVKALVEKELEKLDASSKSSS